MRPTRNPFGARARLARLPALACALALLVAATGAALAQGDLPGSFSIGIIIPDGDGAGPLAAAVARAASQGAAMAGDEFAFNASMLDYTFTAPVVTADGPDAVVAAAETLTADGAFAVVGGFDEAEAAALADWSATAGVPFVNVGASADILRNEQCRPLTFHVEPSAAMYLDAMAGWYVRSGQRNWFFVTGADDESAAQLARVRRTLADRHFGAREVGQVEVAAAADWADVAARATRAKADLVVLLLPAATQVEAVAGLEAGGLQAMVTGFPYPAAQTRAFYAAWRDAAPRLGSGHRIAAWEATIDAYGARELNARYRAAYGEPMDPSAWAVYQGVKVLYEAAFFGGGTDATTVTGYLEDPQSVFDVWKGIGTSFRPWDRQLREPLYLVKVDATATDPFTLATLVGELPAIYMPGTEVVERLDQIGDLAGASRCR